jgi:hypothetical protein
MFGSYVLPHVLNVQITETRKEIERPVPLRNIAYRVDQADLGQTVRVSGEIRETTIDGAHAVMQAIRALNSGVDDAFDLEDGETPAIEALLTDPEFILDVESWFNGKYWIAYSLTFLEVEAP